MCVDSWYMLLNYIFCAIIAQGLRNDHAMTVRRSPTHCPSALTIITTGVQTILSPEVNISKACEPNMTMSLPDKVRE